MFGIHPSTYGIAACMIAFTIMLIFGATHVQPTAQARYTTTMCNN